MKPLSNEVMKAKAPSIFASEPFYDVSDKYAFIPTINVIDVLRDNGWYPVEVMQNNVRIDEKRGYQKHLIRFRNMHNLLSIQENIPEIVLTNSHDKTSSFVLMVGVFRFVCSNGLIVADSMFENYKIKHLGYKSIEVEEAIKKIVAFIPKLEIKLSTYKSITLNEQEQLMFARSAKDIRFEEYQEIDYHTMLQPRRKGDENNDLYTIFNRIEESCIRGGVRGKNLISDRNFTSKPITSIAKLVEINKKLFDLTDKIAQIKLSA